MPSIKGISYSLKNDGEFVLLSIPSFDVHDRAILSDDFKKADILNYV